MKKTTALLTAGAIVAGTAAPGFAASDEEALAKDVQAACIQAGALLFEQANAFVDPHGSESYGLALLRGKAKGADKRISVICVYDKKTKKVEIGGEMPLKSK